MERLVVGNARRPRGWERDSRPEWSQRRRTTAARDSGRLGLVGLGAGRSSASKSKPSSRVSALLGAHDRHRLHRRAAHRRVPAGPSYQQETATKRGNRLVDGLDDRLGLLSVTERPAGEEAAVVVLGPGPTTAHHLTIGHRAQASARGDRPTRVTALTQAQPPLPALFARASQHPLKRETAWCDPGSLRKSTPEGPYLPSQV